MLDYLTKSIKHFSEISSDFSYYWNKFVKIKSKERYAKVRLDHFVFCLQI